MCESAKRFWETVGAWQGRLEGMGIGGSAVLAASCSTSSGDRGSFGL